MIMSVSRLITDVFVNSATDQYRRIAHRIISAIVLEFAACFEHAKFSEERS